MEQSAFRELLSQARGDSPADLVIKNANVVNLFSGRIEETSLAIGGGLVVGLGLAYEGKESLDLGGAYLAPGFIDGHIHIESTLLCPAQLARVVTPHGTGAIIADPHEIANVMGAAGGEGHAQRLRKPAHGLLFHGSLLCARHPS